MAGNKKDFTETKRIMLDFNSAKNQDVFERIINRDMMKYNKVIDYICEAIRNFDENNTIDMNNIESIVERILEKKLKDMNLVSVDKEEIMEEIDEEQERLKNLENNIDDVDPEED